MQRRLEAKASAAQFCFAYLGFSFEALTRYLLCAYIVYSPPKVATEKAQRLLGFRV
jgi:hypothetical protein